MRAAALALASVLACGGCASLMPVPGKMRVVDYPRAAKPAKCLFVLLPGIGDHAETFAKRGFIEDLRARQLSIDIRAAEATFRYYAHGVILERLAADVIDPMKERGYQEIWLLGPSMGGFGSLFYARAQPAQIKGVVAIAPFLGEGELIDEIEAAGGLSKWSAPARVEVMRREDYQREIWRWLHAATQGREPAPLLFLGYGTSDKLARADSLLAAELPPSHVFLTEGKHEWPVWRRVLASFLDSPEFAPHCR